LEGVVVDHLHLGPLPLDDLLTLLILNHLLIDLFDNFIALAVTHIGNVASLIVANVVRNSHEDLIIVEASCCRFNCDFLVGLAL
jgi:hypothetical protein